jgi:transposase
VIGRIDLDGLIFLNESGVSTQMTRLYARCAGGARIHETAPDGRWKILTILGAICTRGMIAAMTIEAATDREIFLAYLDEVLCPKLRIGDVVIMDNLSSHKVQGVRERIEAAGAQLLYLPPYSPDLNPIEKAWAKLKQLLRAAKGAHKTGPRPSHCRTATNAHCRRRKSLVQAPFQRSTTIGEIL